MAVSKFDIEKACTITGEILTNKMFEYLSESISMDKWMKDILQISQRLQEFSTKPSVFKSEEL